MLTDYEAVVVQVLFFIISFKQRKTDPISQVYTFILSSADIFIICIITALVQDKDGNI